ncbi:MAG: glutamyl-tRNA reductase [Akkermansia sp.]
MKMACLGLNHRTTPVEVRERFSVPAHRLAFAGEQLNDLSHVFQCVLLSTCNRMEVYFWSDEPEQAFEQIKEHFLGGQLEHVQNNAFYCKIGNDVLFHLCRVLSGLDSMVLGETEIFGQVKEAYRVALAAGLTGGVSNKTFQKVFTIGKRVRSGTLINGGTTSVGSVAVELAEQIFGQLDGSRVLILGAGEMSRLTGQALKSRGAQSIFVANRTHERALELATMIGGEAVRYDNWIDYLKNIDIVVASTSAPHYLITKELLMPLREKRRYRSLFLIDISVPRNISPDAASIDEVYVYDIDTLQQLANEGRHARALEVERCESIIEANIHKFFPEGALE